MMILVILGLIPLIPGGLMYLSISLNNYEIPDIGHYIITLLTLLLWGSIAYFAKRYIGSTLCILLCLHVIPLVNLLLLGIQEFLLNHYWTNFIGTLTQIYILPYGKVCTFLTGKIGAFLVGIFGGMHWLGATVFAWGLWSVLLMLLAAIIGCNKR